MLPKKQQSRFFRLFGYLWLEVRKYIQIGVQSVSDVEIVVVTTSPSKRLTVRDFFQVVRADATTFKHLLLGEVASDYTDDTYVSKETRGD